MKVIRKPSVAPPQGGIFLGVLNGQRYYLSARDRSFHVIIIGAIGTGKTVTMEGMIRQDIDAGRGVLLLDPMGALFERILAYCCYRRGIGCRIPEVIVFNASDGSWILPVNPFIRLDGELSVQVNRQVSATLRVWGQHSGDETPRLEKWLKVIYFVLIECGLTLMEAGLIIDQHARDIRSHLLRGLKDNLVRRKFEQLSRFKTSEFLEQTESVENRLMRFLASDHLGKIFGTGRNAIDFRSIMDGGKILLVNLQPSNYLSDEDARLVGTLVLNQGYETALTRPSGAKPQYGYVDEAAKFVTPELAQATEQCRQKGFHLTLGFQHLAQFKEEGVRVYKAFKHIRNKLVFAVPDREDALELADDLFVGLTEPQLKFMHRRLNHLVEDVRQTSTTRAEGESASSGDSRTSSQSNARSSGQTHGESQGSNHSVETGNSRGRTFTRGGSFESGTSTGHTHTEHESHSRGFSETNSRQQNAGNNTAETIQEERNGFLTNSHDRRSLTKGQSHSESSAHSRTDTGNDSYDSGDSYTESSTKSSGGSTSVARSQSQQRSSTKGTSSARSLQTSRSQTVTTGDSLGTSRATGKNSSTSVTDQPGTRHTPFWEEDPEHWTLEEQRWRASELLMFQQTGHWFVKTSCTAGFGNSSLPSSFYIIPSRMLRLTRDFYQRHNLTSDEAANLRAERQQNLMGSPALEENTPASAQSQASPIWNRQPSLKPDEPILVEQPKIRRGQRGPIADIENHTKVARIVRAYGKTWATEDSLSEICEKLDLEAVAVPKSLPSDRDHPTTRWLPGLRYHRTKITKAIRYHLLAAGDQSQP